MKLPQIQIRTTDAKVKLNISDPVQHIEQPKAQQHIEQPAAILDIKTKRGQLHIDSSQARRDVGNFPTGEFVRQFAQQGLQKVQQGTARRASEGRQMMQIEKGGNVIPSLAKQNGTPPPKDLGITWIPSVDSVKISYTPGTTDINITSQKPKIDVQVGDVVHNYTPGDVTGTMLQYPSVETTVIKGE
ncbi:DUF6470 family protein [Viridibacillus arvi]|uniref:DUF6470 family protein n=1 Tax=Viridibacillus arvi TaxID=263475 RepID=UPI003D01FD16